jgi:hypothetical protein
MSEPAVDAPALPTRNVKSARRFDTSFGMTSAVAADGTPLSFTGPLTEL